MPKEKIEMIYSAPDKAFRPIDKKEARKAIEKRYNIQEKFILALGGRSSRKNTARLIRAYHLICNEFSEEFKLVILGDGEQQDTFYELAKKLSIEDKIIFADTVPKSNLPFFYNACECFVYPSLYEGIGLPLLEAASCGTPIITSKIAAIPEILGNVCIYVNPYDVIDMAQGLYDTIRDEKLRENLAQMSLEHSKKYSLVKSPQQLMKAYKNML